MDADWVDFKTDVDNVTNLSDNPFVSKICAVTRSQNSKLIDSNWLSGYTTKELENFQKEDSDLGPVHKWLDNNCKPNRDEIASYSPSTRKYWLNYDLLITKNNVLYQKRLQPTGESYQLLVPKVLRKEVMTSCHNTMYSAHFGVNKTKDKIKNCFHWYKMGEDIQSHVNTCSVCNRFKALNRKPKASLQSYTVGYPLDRVAIDVIGPLPHTRQNNKFILVIGDHFTRWMEAFPLPHQQAEKVAEKLVHEFISRFGIPLELHSDQGRNFESKIFTEVCKLLEIHKTRSTSYRPCSNGIIERFNATLEGMIRSFVNKNANDWDLHIGILMAAYRSTVHPATGYSPNMLMLGREITLPPQIIFPFPNCNESMEVETYVSKMRSKLEEIYQLAREHLRSSAVRQKKDYDSRISQNQFCKGSLVYKFNNIFKKLNERWSGPFVIVDILSPVLYKIKNRYKSETVHHDKLKKYQSDDVPAWAVAVQKGISSRINNIEIREDSGEFNITDTSCQTEETFITFRELKAEVNIMKGSHQAELNRFGDYIARLEKRLKMKEEEIKSAERKLRKNEEGSRKQLKEKDDLIRTLERKLRHKDNEVEVSLMTFKGYDDVHFVCKMLEQRFSECFSVTQ
ncbi:Hypothetical predicted protein [Mytilus galloprovincialis]|uniref:Integrase catalytic domain-containing protein n=1 Tax=Mytilus galloprovincialis TaxID=29158 RepID=A0A8B6E562_MYTGA|nr:Hypothetical predicted protein [Mytilus galloprovincialis]